MLIDLSSWYKDSLVQKIEVIRSAIENRNLLEFRYYAPSGESSRTTEHIIWPFSGLAGTCGNGANPERITDCSNGIQWTESGSPSRIVEYLTYDEGLCVQCMHIGAYDDEVYDGRENASVYEGAKICAGYDG